MKEIFIKELLGLKSKLKKVLEEEKDSLRIMDIISYLYFLDLIFILYIGIILDLVFLTE